MKLSCRASLLSSSRCRRAFLMRTFARRQSGMIIRAVLFALCVMASVTTVYPAATPDFRALIDEAEQQARQTRDERTKAFLLHKVAVFRVRTGQIAEARALIEGLRSGSTSDDLAAFNESLAEQLARQGDVSAAIHAADQAGSRKQEALYAIAGELVRQGRLADVDKVLANPSGSTFRHANVAFGLAGLLASQGRTSDTLRMLDRVAAMVEPNLTTNNLQTGTVELALKVAAQRRACGDSIAAERSVSAVQAAISRVRTKDQKELYLSLVASAAASVGDYGMAQQTIDLLTDPFRLAQARGAMARTQIESGHTEAAARTAAAIPESSTRISVILQLADAQAKSDPALARKTIEAVTQDIRHVHADFQAWATANLARVEYALGNRKRASTLWQRAIKESARFTIHPDREQPNLIRYVAELQAEAGEERAALNTARRFADRSALSGIAYVEGAGGRIDSALKWIRKQNNPATRATVLMDLVSGALEARKPSRLSRIAVTPCFGKAADLDVRSSSR